MWYFISGRDANETLSSLGETIHELLLKIYPDKQVGDFTIPAPGGNRWIHGLWRVLTLSPSLRMPQGTDTVSGLWGTDQNWNMRTLRRFNLFATRKIRILILEHWCGWQKMEDYSGIEPPKSHDVQTNHGAPSWYTVSSDGTIEENAEMGLYIHWVWPHETEPQFAGTTPIASQDLWKPGGHSGSCF